MKKRNITILLVALMLSLLLVACGDNEKKSEDENDEVVKTKEDSSKITSDVDYEIHSVDEVHAGQAQRFNYNVIIQEEVTEDDLKAIAQEVVDIAKDETPFNAISVNFFDYPEYIKTGYIFGNAEYVPDGDWGEAVNIKTGDYSTMEFNYKLKANKDWDLRLTQEEVDIYKQWYDISEEEAEKGNFAEDDEINAIVSEITGVPADEVMAIMEKQMKWSFSGDN